LYGNTANRISLISLNSSLRDLFRSAERLSSGLRINRASDDPAGLVISEQLRSRIASLNQEVENISAGINKYKTVSASVGELRSRLTELRSLAVAASNEAVNSEEAQAVYQNAAQDIMASYNFTVQNAEYNGSNTLDGSEGSLAAVDELTGIDLSSAEAAQISIGRIDEAIHELDEIQVELGSTQRHDLESRRLSLEIERENLIAAESQVRDADFGMEYVNLVAGMIRTRAAIAMVAHTALTGASIVNLFDL
jgi:flagellin